MNSNWIGKEVVLLKNTRKESFDHYTITSEDEHGNIICMKINDKSIITRLHPEYVAKLFESGDGKSHIVGYKFIETAPILVAISQLKVEPKVVAKPTTAIVGSKRESAIALYNVMKDNTRKEIIQAFVDHLNMTLAGASTYYHSCKTSWAK